MLNEALEEVFDTLEGAHPCTGTLTLRIDVRGADGSVSDVTFLADTLVPLPSLDVEPSAVRAEIQHVVKDCLAAAVFPESASGDSSITLPIVFE